MRIECRDISKRYKREILFDGFNYHFHSATSHAILGPNSSGKSTMLKILGAALSSTSGAIDYYINDIKKDPEHIYPYFSYAGPEMQLFGDYTLREIFDFHFSLKQKRIDLPQMIEESQLNAFMSKRYSQLSSGLQNKVKLALAMYSDCPALLLDEPCTNFDERNTEWYLKTVQKYWSDRLLIIASNQSDEHSFCRERIYLEDYKR